MEGLSINTEKANQIQEKLDYTFSDKDILELALTHKSVLNDQPASQKGCNERLEFLGDAVLELCVSHYLYEKYPEMQEGRLAKARAATVCEPSLAKCALSLNIADYIILGKGEEHSNGKSKPSILADAVEAIIGAIYLDGGLDSANKFILNALEETLDRAVMGIAFRDYKTELQEMLQKRNSDPLTYRLERETGPAHNKIFTVCVYFGHEPLGSGEGRSKKEAEQNAAGQALAKLKGESDKNK